jgi:PKD repeat protein
MMTERKTFSGKIFVLVLTIVLGFGASLIYPEYRYGSANDNLAQSAAKKPKYNTTRIIVQADSLKEVKKVARENGLKVSREFKALSRTRGHWYGVLEKKKQTDLAIEEIVQNLKAAKGIRHAGLDYEVYTAATPNDPKFSQLWGLHNTGQTGGTVDADIDAPEAWNLTTGSPEVIVAVIDTGVDYTHPDLALNMWKNPGEIPNNNQDDDGNGYVDDIYGIDACNNDSDPYDDRFHGTHCAGTIGARGNDGFGVVGVNWNVKIMALKFLNSSGSGYTSDAVTCMDYVIDQKQKGQNIVAANNSWGGGSFLQDLLDAINTAGQEGILFVASAGNNTSNNDANPYYPASYNSGYVIATAATDSNDALANFSNWGAASVDLGAPGVSIVSDSPGGGFRTLNGTSMAVPHVCGAVALMASIFKNDTALERKNRVLDHVDVIPSLSGKCVSGGRLNINNAALSGPFAAADFTWSKLGTNERQFTDESTSHYCTIVSWDWDFGDGNTSTLQNPTHTYSSDGWYDVTLTVTTNTSAFDSKTRQIWIGPNLNPTANFSHSTGEGFLVHFSDQSTDTDGTVESWSWDFGDGSSSTEQNPSHAYQHPDIYTVILTVTDNEGGSDSASQSVDIPLVYCDSSSLTSNPMGITRVDIGTFANSSGKQEYSDFTHLLINMNTGNTYDISLTPLCASQYYDCNWRMWIDYNLDGDFNDAGELVFEEKMKDQNSQPITGSITIPASAVKNKKTGLRISLRKGSYRDACEESDGWGEVEDYRVIFDDGGSNAPPTADFTHTTDGLTANFTDQSTDSDGTISGWSWDFGDGNTSTQQNPAHTYASAGTYTVTLTVTDNDGASDSTSQSVTVSAPQNQAPTADFTYTSNGLAVNFTDQSTDSDGTISGWSWDFGDGNTSTQQNPAHTYASAGTYTVSLTVTDNDSASDSTSQQVTVDDGGGGVPQYCPSSSFNSNTMAITRVDIGSFSNSSGQQTYSDFTNLTVNMNSGNTYSLSLTPYCASSLYDCYWRIWIDYNRDGDFDDGGELVFEDWMENQNGAPITGSITVPSSGVVTGQKTSMRISLRKSNYRDACEDSDSYGEVEDYAVLIQ